MHPARAGILSAFALLFFSCLIDVNAVEIHPVISFLADEALSNEGDGRLGYQPSGARTTEISITLTPARVKGCTNRDELMADFVTPVYRDDTTGTVALHGPTLRVRQREMLRIHLRNNLTRPTRPPGTGGTPLNGFSHAGDTNLHAHGMHAYPGVAAQAEAATYLDNDNIFFSVLGKAAADVADEELSTQHFTIDVCKQHMPGMAWFHPHHHGSTTVQVPTANGLIIIEGGPEWLPDDNGCAEIRELLHSAPEHILHFHLLPFKPPAKADPKRSSDPQWALDLDDANLQIASKLSDPQNPLCCNQEGQQNPEPFAGSALDQDLTLLNGGYQPRISMKSGVYYRWRLAWATIKRYASIMVVDAATGGGPAPCEMLLVAKDGVYLMEIPRQVDHAFLSPGNRAEVLIRCTGQPGTKYVLRAQEPEASPFGCDLGGNWNVVVQDLATVEIGKGPSTPQPTPKLKACTPARAGYVADLRDDALAAAGATSKLVKQHVTFTYKDFGCMVNGKNFSMPDPNPIELPLGSVVEWTPNHMHQHPFHIHTNPFQIQELSAKNLKDGCKYSSWFEPGDYHDTLVLPMTWMTAHARVRLQPGEYTGYSVLHCHSLHHEDLGCMKVVKFSCPGHDDPQPRVCPGFEFPVPGTLRLPAEETAAAKKPQPGTASRSTQHGHVVPAWLLSWARCMATRLGLALPF